ncbi:hypothetical protein B0H21DRAFT_885793 [Amylocystis lapponica]|nr:hypothetical protein B0H21DRAFT_885793 [Amylocystis lapponica]
MHSLRSLRVPLLPFIAHGLCQCLVEVQVEVNSLIQPPPRTGSTTTSKMEHTLHHHAVRVLVRPSLPFLVGRPTCACDLSRDLAAAGLSNAAVAHSNALPLSKALAPKPIENAVESVTDSEPEADEDIEYPARLVEAVLNSVHKMLGEAPRV